MTEQDRPWTAEHTHRLRQAMEDNKPCATCGGDRLRADFTGSGACHVTTQARNTPVSTPSGPSAGLEGQDQETPDATEAAQRRVDPVSFDAAAFRESARRLTAADAELAEKDATIAELRAEVDGLRADVDGAWAAVSEHEEEADEGTTLPAYIRRMGSRAEARVADLEATVAKVREWADHCQAAQVAEVRRSGKWQRTARAITALEVLAILDAPKDSGATS